MILRLGIFFALALGLAACGEQETVVPMNGETATVFVAAEIITMDAANPRAQMVAISDGRILGVGNSLEELETFTRGYGVTVDRSFTDDILMPGFIDPHLHPMMAAVLLPTTFITPEQWNLPRGVAEGVTTPGAYSARLAEAIAAATSEAPFITWGYHQAWHGPLTRAMLDAIEDVRPVIVWHRSFHEIILNAPAMALLGLESEELFDEALSNPLIDPTHANFDEGHFSETALMAVLPRLQPIILSPEHLSAGFAEMRAMLLQAGVTTIADMATGIFANFDTEAAMIQNAFLMAGTENPAPVRTVLVPIASALVAQMGSIEAADAFIQDATTRYASDRMFLNNRVKLLADGAFFSAAMRMRPPGYLDGHEGQWITEPDHLAELARGFWDAGYSIHTHVNGDEGVDVVLDIVEGLMVNDPQADQRFTLEHFGFSGEDQVERLARLGVQVSAQPNYIYVLSDIYSGNVLGPERAPEMVRMGALRRHGVRLALHSDLTMAPAQPLYLAWIAVNRVNIAGNVMAPGERLSVDDAMRAITIDAAFILGLEDDIGSIEPGKRADFTVLTQSPYDVDPMALRDIPVRGVVFDGTFVSAR